MTPVNMSSQFLVYVRECISQRTYAAMRLFHSECVMPIVPGRRPILFTHACRYIDDIPTAALVGFHVALLDHHRYFELPADLKARVDVSRVAEDRIEIRVSWNAAEA